MGVGQVISGTFAQVKARFGQLLALWAIYFGITIALSFVFAIGVAGVGVAGLASMAEGDILAAGGGIVALTVLFYLGYLLVAMAQYGSLILMASPNDRPTVSAALSMGWRAAPALLLLLVVLILGYLAAALVFGLAGPVFAALGDAGGVVLALLLIPVSIWIGCRLAPMFAVVTVDGVRNPFTAIARSWRLTGGHALTIFLASLLFMAILLLICGLALLPSIGLLRSMANPEALAGAEVAGAEMAGAAVGGFLLMMLGFLVVSVLVNVAYCAFISVLHGTLTGGDEAAKAFA